MDPAIGVGNLGAFAGLDDIAVTGGLRFDAAGENGRGGLLFAVRVWHRQGREGLDEGEGLDCFELMQRQSWEIEFVKYCTFEGRLYPIPIVVRVQEVLKRLT